MSGIVGIFRRSGAAVELPFLQSLTDSLAYRGPDAREVWSDGPVGFGHSMLRTTHEAERERQPATLDGLIWITADVRLDSRAELVRRLQESGAKCSLSSPDPELILHSYSVWSEACLQHLRGDFAFTLWDPSRQQVFCARDHFGIKPFFYALKQDLFLFSNTLNCLRLHPEISREVNESAIGDFLLFGLNCNVAATGFRDIQRLPAGHFLVVGRDAARIERYWSPPVDGHIRFRRPEDYVDRLREILNDAVADRLRTYKVGILLSGGLDSGSVAATASKLSQATGAVKDLQAYTTVFKSLFADPEGSAARATADFLNIPIHHVAMDDASLFDRWNDPEMAPPEPVGDPFGAAWFNKSLVISKNCRVVLSGEGADNLLDFQMWPYARDLWNRREWNRLASELPLFLCARPFPWRGIRQRLASLLGRHDVHAQFLEWIDEDFAKRLDLHQRWKMGIHQFVSLSHPTAPRAHASLSLPHWTYVLGREDPGVTRCAVEVRYPYLDLRVVEYLLGIPRYPWAFDKRIIRDATQGSLPEEIRLRKKLPLAGSPILKALKQPESEWISWFPREQIAKYINPDLLPDPRAQKDAESAGVALRPLCLNFWLQSVRRSYTLTSEAHNGTAGQGTAQKALRAS